MARKLSGTAISPGTITVTQLETTVVTAVTTGGGPKIANIQITANNYSVLDDTAVDTAGGYIKLNGSGFVNGCIVVINGQQATSTGFVSATQVQAQVPALTAGTYPVYLINPDGGTAIRVPGLTYSATPTWVTSSSLSEGSIDIPISVQFSANGASVYSLAAGSSLPAGLTLSNVGLLSGTVTGLLVDTVYSFTVVATDAELQDSPRTFTITITAADQYFRYTTLLLSGDFPSSANLAYNSDASTNNFLVTASGDVGPRPFNPYLNNYSVFFDGTNDYCSLAGSADFSIPTSTTPFTVEAWVYLTSASALSIIWTERYNGSGNTVSLACGLMDGSSFWTAGRYLGFAYYNGSGWTGTASTAQIELNTWSHVAYVFTGSACKIFLNGVDVTKAGGPTTWAITGVSGEAWYIGAVWDAGIYLSGYISNLRYVVGTAVYTSNFTPSTTSLQNITNTKLLACQSNRFVDNSSSPKTITPLNGVAVSQNSPFVSYDTTNGSGYFDGSGDYLEGNNLSSFNFLHSPSALFTIQCWVYIPSVISSGSRAIVATTPNSGGVGTTWTLEYYNSAVYMNLFIARGVGGVWVISGYSTSAFTTYNQWTHLAVTYDQSLASNNATFYINGQTAGTASKLANAPSSSNASYPLYIGRIPTTSTLDFNGYIADLQISNSILTITVPTIPQKSTSSTQLLTLQTRAPATNNGFIDSSPNEFLITRNGNATQGSFSPFSPGGWSGYWPGTDINSGFSIGTNVFGANDFTVEFYYWLNDLSVTAGTLVASPLVTSHNWYGGTSNYSFSTYAFPTAIGFALSTGGGSNEGTAPVTGITVNTTDHRNGWVHIAAVRSGGTIRLFVNGSGTSSALSSNTGINLDARNIYVGRWFDSASAPSAERYGKGYFHSLRVIVGQALYTGNFTVGGQSLTSTSVGTTGANVAASITGTVHTLALQSNRFINRVGNVAYTVTGNTSIQSFSPFAPTASYSPAVHGGSGYFDGTGDYLNSTIISLSNFTIEVWAYFTQQNSQTVITIGDGNTSSGVMIYTNSSGFITAGNSTGSYISSVKPNINSWTHLAITRSGSTLTLYVNGVSLGTANMGSTALNTTLRIGVEYYGATLAQYWNGYIGSLRISNNVRSDLTAIPILPYSSDENTSFLLNFTNAAVADLTGRNNLESVGNVQSSRTQAKWNYLTTGAALYFPKIDTDYLKSNLASTDLCAFGSGDFVIEFWLRLVAVPGSGQFGIIYDSRPLGVSGAYPMIYVDNATLKYYVNVGDRITGSTLSINTWYYIAVARASGNTRLYIDGQQQGSTYPDSNVYLNGSQRPAIGASGYGPSGTVINGFIDDLRVTKGSARGYTGATIPVPSGPFKTR